MTYATLRREDIISSILNWVCPECGGSMGGQRKEFQCQGRRQRDWHQLWESQRVTKGRNDTNSPHVVGKGYATVLRTAPTSRQTAEFGEPPKAPPTSQAIMANAKHPALGDALSLVGILAH